MLNSQCAQPEMFQAQVRYGSGDNFTAFQSDRLSFNSSNQVCLPVGNLDSGTFSYIVLIFQGSSISVDDSQVTTESLGGSLSTVGLMGDSSLIAGVHEFVKAWE